MPQALEHEFGGQVHYAGDLFTVKVVAPKGAENELGSVPLEFFEIDLHVVPALVVFIYQPEQLLGMLALGFHFGLRFGLPSPASAARPRMASRRRASARVGRSNWLAHQSSIALSNGLRRRTRTGSPGPLTCGGPGFLRFFAGVFTIDCVR
jgi:hypothetical protein